MADARDLSRRVLETLTELARDTLACGRFYTRLPLPVLPFEHDPHGIERFGRAIRMLPVAGAIVGCFGALALLFALALRLPALLAATAAVAVLVRTTGGLHEDGLADTADGFGGASERDDKLAIMKDSRIGAHGTMALMLATIARIAAIAALADRTGPWGAAAAIVAAAALSRVAGLIPLAVLPAARPDGAAHAAGAPQRSALITAAGISAVMALVLAGPTVGWTAALFGCALAAGAGLYIAHLAHRHLDGHTGDVAGAAQQLAEIAFLAALLTGTRVG